MQAFELHFNPEKREDIIFDSFCYEPENVYEKQLGNLYMVGLLENVLPPNNQLLSRLASFIKNEYYRRPRLNAETALKETLKRTNDFLEDEVKKGNVSWLGNLSFSVLQIKDFALNFTKLGKLNILLIRGDEIIDIGTNLEFQDVEPYPLKIFTNIASGKIADQDKILVLSGEVAEAFTSQNILENLTRASGEKDIRKALKLKEDSLSQLSGIALLCFITPLSQVKEVLTLKQKTETFSFQKALGYFLRAAGSKLRFTAPKVPKVPGAQTLKAAKSFALNFSLKPGAFRAGFEKRSKTVKSFTIQKMKLRFILGRILFIPLLVFVLLAGFFIFEKERAEDLKRARLTLQEAQSLKVRAESALIFKDEALANKFFQRAFEMVLPQTASGSPLKEEAEALKSVIEIGLAPLNKMEIIDRPEPLLRLSSKELGFLPQNIMLQDANFILFNPNRPSFYQLSIDGAQTKSNLFQSKRNLNLGLSLFGKLVFFAEPSAFLSFSPESSGFIESSLILPYPNFDPNAWSSYQQSIYFLDQNSGEIVKYVQDQILEPPALWIDPQENRKTNLAKSIAVDGNVWILTKDNKIDRYFAGTYRETLELAIFPKLQNPTKIWTSVNHPYLYILEPAQERLIVITKFGEIVKQYKSQAFDNLLDFAVSQDSRKIYLLNDLDIFQIELKD